MNYKIAVYTDNYKQSIIDLILPIQTEEFNVAITAADQPDLQDIPGYYQQGTGNFWAAIIDNTVIGTIALSDIGDQQGALRKMFVHKDYRGKEFGVAQALLNTLLSWAKEKGLQEIFLGTTDKFHAAHRFYEKNHFHQVTVDSLPANFSRMAVDSIFYKYSFK
ncbi:GNAT family N-acetyltransferase [Niastella yeongjuensis]|uniref:GNAT family N-acetyltransferase n=1 Tax=Niastella yeongjuensis TaxID=354355 RepID=A0A1V9F5C7_9BACT|nr:GNAT family N-acetyltransferase [Niastella yeongjuensis]OQP53436.1 GNAT family N-acetyltransferase [Niastella yeongjuensis]SEP12279.1 Acetyltransferase (GNAT) family protein [Niastella yeongjuensis]